LSAVARWAYGLAGYIARKAFNLIAIMDALACSNVIPPRDDLGGKARLGMADRPRVFAPSSKNFALRENGSKSVGFERNVKSAISRKRGPL